MNLHLPAARGAHNKLSDLPTEDTNSSQFVQVLTAWLMTESLFSFGKEVEHFWKSVWTKACLQIQFVNIFTVALDQ